MTTLSEIAANSVDSVDSPTPARVAPDTELADIVALMAEQRRNAVLVVDGDRLVGIFTERDLMARVDHSDPAWTTVPVSKVMTKAPRTVRVDQTVEDALNMMLVGVYRHLPTTDSDGALEGMVSIIDLLVHIASFFPEDFVNLPSDPQHEATGRWGG